jgi:tRNA-dihydrouridine synthase
MAHTEMVNASGFVRSAKYRDQILGRGGPIQRQGTAATCQTGGDGHSAAGCATWDSDPSRQERAERRQDHPLVLQLGGADLENLVAAARLAVRDGRCVAVELNCGCPQRCAKKGGYGAFLLEPGRRAHLVAIVSALREALPASMPLLAKIRVLSDIGETVALARCLVASGVGVLTVHGRTRRQGGGAHTVGERGERLASWPHIRAVKAAVPVPCVANGNVPDAAAVDEALQFTGCDALMSGCGLLRNPMLFQPSVGNTVKDADDEWRRVVGLACEYIELAVVHWACYKQVSHVPCSIAGYLGNTCVRWIFISVAFQCGMASFHRCRSICSGCSMDMGSNDELPS